MKWGKVKWVKVVLGSILATTCLMYISRDPLPIPSPVIVDGVMDESVNYATKTIAEETTRDLEQGDIPSQILSAVKKAFGQAANAGYAIWSAEELLEALESGNSDLEERQKMLWALCHFDDSSVRAFLSRTISNASENEYLRASILDGLVAADKFWAYDFAFELLGSDSEVVARAAIRVLGQFGGEDAVVALSQLANDFRLDPTISLAAAEALGVIGSPEAGLALMELFEYGLSQGEDAAIEHALSGLGRIESQESGEYLKEIYELASDSNIRILVVESLEESSGDISAIARLAMNDEDADVRAAAAWALAYADDPGLPMTELMGFLEVESDSEVRANLYHALDNQEDFNVERVMSLLAGETNPTTKLAGFQLVCRKLPDMPDGSYETISRHLVNELRSLKKDEGVAGNQLRVIDRLIDQAGVVGRIRN